MTSVLQSFRANLTEESVFRFKVVNYIAKEPYLSSDPSFSPDYVWSGTREAVTLGQASRVAHGFPVWNFTFPLGCEAAPGSGLDVDTPFCPLTFLSLMRQFMGCRELVATESMRTNEDRGGAHYLAHRLSVFGGSSAGSTYAFAERLAGVFRLFFTVLLDEYDNCIPGPPPGSVAMPAFMYPAARLHWTLGARPAAPRVLDTHFPWIGAMPQLQGCKTRLLLPMQRSPRGDVDAQKGATGLAAQQTGPRQQHLWQWQWLGPTQAGRRRPRRWAHARGGPRRRRQQGGLARSLTPLYLAVC